MQLLSVLYPLTEFALAVITIILEEKSAYLPGNVIIPNAKISRSAFVTLGERGGTLRDCCLIHRSGHGWGM